MNLKEIYEITVKAFQTGHVKELLLGEQGWRVPFGNRFSPGRKPTDWGRIVTYAIVPLCGANNMNPIITQFREGIKSLIDTNEPVAIWAAFEVYSAYCYTIRSNDQNILFSSELKRLLEDAVKTNELALKTCKEWDGHLYKDGLWDAITGSDAFLESKFGMGIL